MSDLQPLVHIGYQKTASSWLQNKVFNAEESVFGQPCQFTYGEAHEHFIYGREFHFNPDKARRVFEPGIRVCEEKSLIPVISNENLVGNPIVPYSYGKLTAERIHSTFPEARILVFLREQKDMIAALYRQYIRAGNKLSLQDFLLSRSRKSGFLPTFLPERLKYDVLISHYIDLFGSERVLVLSYEEFRQSNLDALKKILVFVGRQDIIDLSEAAKSGVNVGYRGLTLEFRRRLNHFMPKPYFGSQKNPLGFRLSESMTKGVNLLIPKQMNKAADSQMIQVIDEFIGNFYHKSNIRTKELTGITFDRAS
ncbi:MAG: hypothetical protein F6K42_09505 [Leptolyngbya sp. SIO1D8]|nr:hypothetical protein [Leptolyngbya sp. SIO1D8]